MAKCPRCSQRKGKRTCPALDTTICAACCADERLATIDCPRDCRYLAGEHYQLRRRRERASSSGRRLLETLGNLFVHAEGSRYAFLILADTYWWTVHNGAASDADLAQALRAAKESASAPPAPATPSSPLGTFLRGLVTTGPTHQKLARTMEQRVDSVLETLARRAEQGDEASPTFVESIDGYFAELDFEADLDYSPAEELDATAREADGPTGIERHTQEWTGPAS